MLFLGSNNASASAPDPKHWLVTRSEEILLEEGILRNGLLTLSDKAVELEIIGIADGRQLLVEDGIWLVEGAALSCSSLVMASWKELVLFWDAEVRMEECTEPKSSNGSQMSVVL